MANSSECELARCYQTKLTINEESMGSALSCHFHLTPHSAILTVVYARKTSVFGDVENRQVRLSRLSSKLCYLTDMQWLLPSYSTTQHPLHIQHWLRMKKTKSREMRDAVMVYVTVYQYGYSTSPTITASTPNTMVHRKKIVSVALTVLLNGQCRYADGRCTP
jgi:hypothetical protein